MNALISIALADHAHIQDQFELYADAEVSGEAVQELFPDVYAHLQTCADCRQAYAEFKAESSE